MYISVHAITGTSTLLKSKEGVGIVIQINALIILYETNLILKLFSSQERKAWSTEKIS